MSTVLLHQQQQSLHQQEEQYQQQQQQQQYLSSQSLPTIIRETILLSAAATASSSSSPTSVSASTSLKVAGSKRTTKRKSSNNMATALSNEDLRFSYIDNIGLKQLWKLIAIHTTPNTTTTNTATKSKTKTNSIYNDVVQSNNNKNKQNNANCKYELTSNNLHDTQIKQQQQQQSELKGKQIKSHEEHKQSEQININNNSSQSNNNIINNNNCNNNNGKNSKININQSLKNNENYINFADYSSSRDILMPNSMSLLKFLAISALELSAPASPIVLQQQQQQQQQQQKHQLLNQSNNNNNSTSNNKKQSNEIHKISSYSWMQLSGHPESIVPTESGIVRKRVSSLTEDNEVKAYQRISQETQTAQIVPQFHGTAHEDNSYFIELEDLLAGFKDPCVMDIKLGSRTFLESEVSNKTVRPDLYKKMIAVDPDAPTIEEHEAKAITKLRYMTFRDKSSSSYTKGFRIEAMRLRGRPPMKDLKTVRTSDQIAQTIEQFLGAKRTTHKELIKRLKHIRRVIEKSSFFQQHEIVGSSIFIVYDDTKVNAWLIDFAKSRPLPKNISTTHRAEWSPGNHEEGLLKGMDELINTFEEVYTSCNASRKCLHI